MPCHQPPMDIRSPDVLARRPAIIGKAAVGLRTRLKHMKQKVGWNRVCIYRALLNNDTFGYIKFIYIYIYCEKLRTCSTRCKVMVVSTPYLNVQ